MGTRGGGRFAVGDYVVGKQIGSGSFSTVWHARHRVDGTEVAIKEILTARLNSKLHDSLKSEIVILQKINHPNIIHLHDMIEESGKIYIILEYCRGGDLSVYIQKRQGKIPESTAKHFMQQLASGLKVLREHNLIHRDLKPQNLLLLSANDDKSVLKIADFGFARSLQPRGLAETLCGSPLYMAPEIMQLQKYDAKADLWSVGTILYQLVIGKTPFTGSNQIQLLQNIMKTDQLEFHPDISPVCIDLCRKLIRRNPVERLTFQEFFNHPFLSQEGCLPFGLDDDYRRSVSRKPEMKESIDIAKSQSKVSDSLELIDQEYVLVSRRPPVNASLMLSGGRVNRLERCGSAPVTSPGSMDHMTDAIEQGSRPDSMTRIRTLQRCASIISELVKEKMEASKHLEALSLQLVILALWKQILHVRRHSASDTEIETASFLIEVGRAEELANVIEPGNTEMPDAMETIFQSALDLGRLGGVDEYMGNSDGAVLLYSKAVILFTFLLVEAPALVLNPPFSLSNADRLRLGNYIDILNKRQNISRSQKMNPP